ncbi:hypothetical protein GCM10007061_25240 [Kocuria marina]|nr:hypothetical protein GCM10007061_25240 [Kocuria marina]
MPLVEGLILLAVLLLLTIVFLLVMVFAAPERIDGDLLAMNQLDPVVFFILFGSVVLMLPSALLARLVLGPRPLGLLFSVTGRIRWKWLLTCFVAAVAIYALINAIAVGLELAAGGRPVSLQPAPGFWWLMALLIFVVPLQCAAEEVVFRGYLAQTIGRWLKHPAWAILLPVPLFVLGHAYDIWGQLSVGIMAVAMGIITWRTGGLEAAIALHAVNNMTVSLMAMVGLTDMNDTSGAPTDLIAVTLINGGYVALVFWLVRRNRSVAVTRTIVLPPLPQPARLPELGHRPSRLAEDASGLAAYVLDPATQRYLVLPPQYGPYSVRDGQGRYVGLLDTRAAHGAHTGDDVAPAVPGEPSGESTSRPNGSDPHGTATPPSPGATPPPATPGEWDVAPTYTGRHDG